MKNYRKSFKNTLIVLLSSITLFASCKKDDPQSAACDITLFSVDGKTWTISGTDITRDYSAETLAAPLTPTISLSPGATVNPPSGEAQNFFTESGVTYTVTAEDGVTKKTYTAKAVRALYSACDLVSFSVNGTEWNVDDSLITYSYPAETVEGPLTPTITLSPGATVNPPSGEAQNFFTAQGVTYTVTSEGGMAMKTYTARARRMYSGCDIVSFSVDGMEWDINGLLITNSYPEEARLTPVITLSPGATVNPSSNEAHDFFTAQGVTYTVRAENGATKTYTVKATATGVMGKYDMKNWAVLPRNGNHSWASDGAGSQNLWSGGHPMLILDDDSESGWHSNAGGGGTPFPQILIIDMKESVRVSKITGSGAYLKNMQIYLTDNLSIPEYSSYTVDWNDDRREEKYNEWSRSLTAMVPDIPMESWGSPVAEDNVEETQSFSFILPYPYGRFLILRFPDNNIWSDEWHATYIAIFGIEVYGR
jgi:hypothetical protein